MEAANNIGLFLVGAASIWGAMAFIFRWLNRKSSVLMPVDYSEPPKWRRALTLVIQAAMTLAAGAVAIQPDQYKDVGWRGEYLGNLLMGLAFTYGATDIFYFALGKWQRSRARRSGT